MKEKEFDSFIKNKVEKVDNLIGIEFEEHVVWGKVNTKIPKSSNGGLYFFVFASIVTLMVIVYFSLFAPNSAIPDKKEVSTPVKEKVELIIDTMINEEIIKKTKSVTYNKNNPKTNPIKKELTSKKIQIVDTSDTVNVIKDTLNQKSIDINKVNQPSSNKSKSYHVDFAEVAETRAYVHVYRPGKIAGALNMFSLKANGKNIGTITNGEYEVFMVESGLTEFEIKRKKIKIDLKARKSYYLRTELIFLGKTKFEHVTESFAREELGSKK